MALKITQQYATQADALYDIASNSKYFDEGGYSAALEAGRGDEYKMAVIGASEQEAPSDFSRYFYDKLQGTDFQKGTVLDVKNQVERLICQATSHENLAQSYLGWCPFW